MYIIIGGGTAGCLLSYFLSKKKINHYLLEKGKIGIGSDSPLNGTNSGGYLSKIASTITESSLQELSKSYSYDYLERYLKIMEQGADIHKNICQEKNIKFINKEIIIFKNKTFMKKEYKLYRQFKRNPILKKNQLIFKGQHIFNSEEFCLKVIKSPYCTIFENTEYINHTDKYIQTNRGNLEYSNLFFSINNSLDNSCDKYMTFMIHGTIIEHNLPYYYPIDNDDGIYYCSYDNILFLGGKDIPMEEYSLDKHQKVLNSLKKRAKEINSSFKYISENFGIWSYLEGELPKVLSNNNVHQIYGCNAIGQSSYTYIIKNFIDQLIP